MEVSALNQPVLAGLKGPSPLLRLQSDERLIALTRRGQHAAFETLFARYQPRLLAFCRHMVGSREDAEDVLQDVFAAAFNAVLADERAINVRPWLYRIARNRSLNHLRRTTPIAVDSMDMHFADHGLSTSERVMRRESFRQLIADVRLLPESQRTALLLREMDALSYEQIADVMETTVPSVKSLLVRARVSLAEAAEARKLSCEDVREELGEVAEGLVRLSAPARRHIRTCTRCRSFQKAIKANNLALAAVMPVGAFMLIRKLLLAKLGSTAGAGSAHVAGAGTAGASAGAAAAGATGSGAAGSLITAGAGALATKAVAGLAAAALVTAGAVEADHVTAMPHHRRSHSQLAAAAPAAAEQPVVVSAVSQPSTTATDAAVPATVHSHGAAAALHPRIKAHPKSPEAPAPAAAGAAPSVATSVAPKPEAEGDPKPPTPPATQVTTETTPLPSNTQVSEPVSATSLSAEGDSAPAATPAGGEPAPPAASEEATAEAPPPPVETTTTTAASTTEAPPASPEPPPAQESAPAAAAPAQ